MINNLEVNKKSLNTTIKLNDKTLIKTLICALDELEAYDNNNLESLKDDLDAIDAKIENYMNKLTKYTYDKKDSKIVKEIMLKIIKLDSTIYRLSNEFNYFTLNNQKNNM